MNKHPQIPPSLRAGLTVLEAAQYAGVCRASIYNLLKDKKLKSALIRRRRLILRESIDALLADTAA